MPDSSQTPPPLPPSPARVKALAFLRRKGFSAAEAEAVLAEFPPADDSNPGDFDTEAVLLPRSK